MSRKQKIKHMSSDELKAKLYSHFQKSGSLDHLRSQLRGQLVSELFKISEPVNSKKNPSICDVDKCLLPIQVCNWLVYDHLSRQDYQYSLSTFVTEAQLPYPEKFLTAGDILGLLGLKNEADFETISKLYSINNELGFLHSLLLAIIKTMFNVSNKDFPLDASCSNSVAIKSEKLLQNKCEGISNIAFQDLTQLKQINLNKSFLSNDNTRSAEISFHKEFERCNEEKEKEVQKMRQRLLNELDSLYSQKRTMQSELECMKSHLKKEQNKLLREKEMLKEKEVLLEKELTNQVEMKMRNLESEFVEKLHYKDREIESLKRKLSEKDEKLSYKEVELASEKENNRLMNRELNDFKNMNKVRQDKYTSVLDENTNLLRKFENMSDYSLVKEELSFKSREVTRLQNEIRDLHQKSEAERRKYVETVRNLENNLNMKEPELIEAREEIEDVRNTLRKEQAAWNKERRKFECELRESKERYEAVIQKLKERNEEIEDLHQTIQVLNYKLTNNIVNTSKSESLGLYKSSQRPIINQKSLFTKRSAIQPQSEKNYDSRFNFLSEKKSTYSLLKQEDNKVQEKYSIMYSSVPEDNTQMPYLRNYNISSLPIKDSDSHDRFPKSATLNSSFNYDKSKFFPATTNPSVLSNARRLVTHSAIPYKTSKLINFKASMDNFAASHLRHFRDTGVKETWKGPETSSHNFNKQNDLIEGHNVCTLSTRTQINSRNTDNTTSDNALHFNSENINNKNHETVYSSKEIISEVVINSDNRDKLLKNDKGAVSFMKDSLKDTVIENSPVNIVSTTSQNLESILEQENLNQNVVESETVLIDSGEHLYSSTSKILEKEQETNVFVNLDDAWKKRPSISSLSYKEDRIMNLKDNSLYSSSLASNSTAFDSSIKRLDKLNKEDTLSNLVENIDSMTGNVDGTTCLEQNTGKLADSELNREIKSSLCDKSFKNAEGNATKHIEAPNELQTLNRETRDGFNTEEDPIREIKEIDKYFGSSNREEEQTKESAEENKKFLEKAFDSFSEQSEFHLSCGSENEQLKEDSDAW